MEYLSLKSTCFVYVWLMVLVGIVTSISGAVTSDVIQEGEWKADVSSLVVY